jgi:hypothetical protein
MQIYITSRPNDTSMEVSVLPPWHPYRRMLTVTVEQHPHYGPWRKKTTGWAVRVGSRFLTFDGRLLAVDLRRPPYDRDARFYFTRDQALKFAEALAPRLSMSGVGVSAAEMVRWMMSPTSIPITGGEDSRQPVLVADDYPARPERAPVKPSSSQDPKFGPMRKSPDRSAMSKQSKKYRAEQEALRHKPAPFVRFAAEDPVERLGLTNLTAKALRRSGIVVVAELLTYTLDDLRDLRGMGAIRVDEVEMKCRTAHLVLGDPTSLDRQPDRFTLSLSGRVIFGGE